MQNRSLRACFLLPVAAGAFVVGLCVDAEVDPIFYLVARASNGTDYGLAYGALYTLFLVGVAVGPAVAGALFDATENDSGWLGLAALLLFLSAGSALRMPSRST